MPPVELCPQSLSTHPGPPGNGCCPFHCLSQVMLAQGWVAPLCGALACLPKVLVCSVTEPLWSFSVPGMGDTAGSASGLLACALFFFSGWISGSKATSQSYFRITSSVSPPQAAGAEREHHSCTPMPMACPADQGRAAQLNFFI